MRIYNIKLIFMLLIIVFSYKYVDCNYVYGDNPKPQIQKFTNNILPKLKKFSNKYLSEVKNNQAILYPFGGPDLIYPIVLFPNANIYTLIGLERIGRKIENLSFVNKDYINKSLDSLLKRSFFVTHDMCQDITSEEGVLPLLITQLNILNCEVEHFKYLDFDFGNSIEITFNHLGVNKKIIYLKSNLQNEYLKDSLLDYIDNNNLLDICMIKSDSYNMHKNEFSKIRDFVIKKANTIFQDDSGIPINNLIQDFDIQLFGNYISPYGKEWVNYTQTNLLDMYKSKLALDKLDFCYGYGCGRVMPAIILAVKK